MNKRILVKHLTISCSGARNSPRPLNILLGTQAFKQWYVTFAIITDIYC